MSQSGKVIEHVSLFYREGTSDKQYDVLIREIPNEGFIVEYGNGRRGSALKYGLKTSSPVSQIEAKKVFEKTVREKTAKGYTAGETGVPFAGTEKAGKVSGISCQLLNEVDDTDVDRLIEDPEWIMQLKADGDRRLLEVKGDFVSGINRNGLYVPLPEPVVTDLKRLDKHYIFDGEIVGNKVYVFDMLVYHGDDIRNLGFDKRYSALLWTMTTPLFGSDNIILLDAALNAADKRKLYEAARQSGAEGVVFKQRFQPYTPGRPNSGGGQLKFKFWNTATVRIAAQNGDRRSVAMELHDGSAWVPAGNVTIPANVAIPQSGSIAEVRYLYAYQESGALYQPTWLRQRDDVGEEACVTSQLKYVEPLAEETVSMGMRP
jgi:ATP-dependent DNA ligase